jgi:hypothetical protein
LLVTFGALALDARADAIPYPASGTPNVATYSFTAMNTGDVTAYFAGSTASYDNELGLLINGVSTGIVGLDNHTSVAGQSLILGHANAGDTLTFVLQNNTLGMNAYSDPSLNVPYDVDGSVGHQHVYSTPYTGGGPIIDSIPPGIFVAFEDLRFPSSDFNYNDEDFVFTNVAETTPEPVGIISLVGMSGVGLVGLMLQRRRTIV